MTDEIVSMGKCILSANIQVNFWNLIISLVQDCQFCGTHVLCFEIWEKLRNFFPIQDIQPAKTHFPPTQANSSQVGCEVPTIKYQTF